MTDFITRLSMTPYLPEGRDWYGVDCFGLVELWHREQLGIDIRDRTEHESTPNGFQGGYDAQSEWIACQEPVDHAVIVMRSLWNNVIVPYGHCGIYWQGEVIHIEAQGGFQCQPFHDRRIVGRVTDIRIHEQVIA